MTNSVQGRMGLLFSMFAGLVIVSVAASTWIINAQKQDALVINLAGRQRMLIQQMTKDVLQIEKSRQSQPAQRQSLAEAARMFEQTLHAFARGGPAPYLPDLPVIIPATQNPAILNTLDQLAQNWGGFRTNLDTVATAQPGSPELAAAVRAVEAASPQLVQQADVAVRLFENESAQKVVILRSIQFAFLASALALLLIGFWLTQKSVIEPLGRLSAAAARIGRGDLRTPVAAAGPREIRELGHNFDRMRSQLKTSQEELELRVDQRTRELTTAFELSQEIVTELELENLLSSVTHRAQELLGARAASLCMLTANGEQLVLKASSGDVELPTPLHQPTAGRELSSQVITHGQTTCTETACANCSFLSAYHPGQCMATPLRTGDHTLGALCVVRDETRGFEATDTRALTLLANSAATAIANVHLIEAEQQQARTAASLAEREQLAAELHDNLAQTLSFLNLKTDRLQELVEPYPIPAAQSELSRMKSAIEVAYGQVRAALVGLREPVAAGNDFAANLSAVVKDLAHAGSTDIDLVITHPSALKLPDIAQKQALHIVKESLNNTRRHAQAQSVQVRVDRENGCARFSIGDDGQGFDPANLPGDGHYGLTIMRARAERCGGSLEIQTEPGAGTTIVARLPLEKKLQE